MNGIIMAISDPFSNAVMDSLFQCQSYTNLTGNEYGIGLKDDVSIIELVGDKQSIQCDNKYLKILKTCDIFVHSHPVVGCLSRQDIECSVKFGCTVVAITPRSDLFWTTGQWSLFNLYNLAHLGHSNYTKVVLYNSSEKIKELVNYLGFHVQLINTKPEVDIHAKLTKDTQTEVEAVQDILNKYQCLY
jgi:hypothetical protein